MPMQPRYRWLWLAWLPAVALADAMPPTSEQGPATLDNGVLQMQLTPAFGGRVLELHRVDEPNFLRVGEAVRSQPAPQVHAGSGDIAYLGHDVWVGPQSQWWLHQQVNPERLAGAANWPPDPWLSLAPAQWLQRDARRLALRGAASPVTGMQLEKTFELDPQRKDTLRLQVTGRNVRDAAVAWDLWFNTRVHADTRVFVPVASADDIRVEGRPAEAAPDHRWQARMLVLAADASSRGPRGKWFVQPAAGWMAGFRGHQALVIRFAHQARTAIHPQQGQVEFYLDAGNGGDDPGLLEMEVHAPYRSLQPGQQMQAGEQWTLLQWDGGDDLAAQRDFLCAQSAALQLPGACTDD